MAKKRGDVRSWGALLLATQLLLLACGDDGGEASPETDAGIDGSRPIRRDSSLDARISDAATDARITRDGGPPPSGDTWAYTSAGRLVYFERATGELERSLPVTGMPAGETVWGADIRPADGAVIVLSSAGKLYQVDPSTGLATLKSTLVKASSDTTDPFTTLLGTAHGVDFNPVVDRLRIVSNSGQNLRVDVDTGETITDTPIVPATPGITAVAYNDSFKESCRTRLYAIDGNTRRLLLQDPPNDGKVSELGSLGRVSIGKVHSFDIATRSSGANIGLVVATNGEGEEVSEVDLNNGRLGPPTLLALDSGETVQALLLAPPSTAPRQNSGELLATTNGNRLISFERSTPGKLCTSFALTGLDAGDTVVGADVRPGDKALWALTRAGKLYTVARDGTATFRSKLVKAEGDVFSSLVGEDFDMGFNPVADRLRIIGASGQNLRVDVDTGVTTTDSQISASAGTPGVTAFAYTNSFVGTRATALYALDTTSDNLVLIGAAPIDAAACPNSTNPSCGVSSSIQPLGLDLGPLNGFDIDPVTGVALAAAYVGDAASSTLYSVNLTVNAVGSSTLTAVGVIGGGERLRSLSFANAPTLTAWAASSDGKLLSFSPAAPETTLTSVPISGLANLENILGIDVRPADGKLYGIGSTGRVYQLDVTDGSAEQVAILAAATSSAFTALPVGTFGFDVNPVADALRLVDSVGDNFRILPSGRPIGTPAVNQPAGATYIDTRLSPSSATIVAAAYTNSFAGAKGTTLFVIGGGTSTLFRVGDIGGAPASPNGGLLNAIGPLGVSSGDDVGFDIVGGQNGLSLAVVNVAGQQTLYSITLRTGVATPYNPSGSNVIKSAGTRPVHGFALQLQ